MIITSNTNAGIDLINKGVFNIPVINTVRNASSYNTFLFKDTNKLIISTIDQRKNTIFPNRQTSEPKIQFVVPSVCPNKVEYSPEYLLIPVISSISTILLAQKYKIINITVRIILVLFICIYLFI